MGRFGQSERLTVSPGREEEGLYNLPGGQSGHPLSPFFLGEHARWVAGEPAPLLPGGGGAHLAAGAVNVAASCGELTSPAAPAAHFAAAT